MEQTNRHTTRQSCKHNALGNRQCQCGYTNTTRSLVLKNLEDISHPLTQQSCLIGLRQNVFVVGSFHLESMYMVLTLPFLFTHPLTSILNTRVMNADCSSSLPQWRYMEVRLDVAVFSGCQPQCCKLWNGSEPLDSSFLQNLTTQLRLRGK